MENYVNYKNKSQDAILDRVEFTQSERGDNFVFFHSHRYASRESLRHHLDKHLPDLEILSKTTIKGVNTYVARTTTPPAEFIENLQEKTGDIIEFHKEKPKKIKQDLIKLRGHIGVFAQFLMVASAFFDGDKKPEVIKAQAAKAQKIVDAGLAQNADEKTIKKFEKAKIDAKATHYFKTADGQAKIYTSAIGLVGNGINSIWGVQEEMDNTRLNFSKDLINKGITLRHNDIEKDLPSAKETKRKKANDKAPNFMKRNSIRVGSVVKLASKYALTTGDSKDLKMSGWLSIIGKIISLTGLPEDRFNLEKKNDKLSLLRRNSNFISSLFDWTSTFSLFAGSLRKESFRNANGTQMNDLEKEAAKEKRSWFSLFDFKNTENRSKDTIQWWQLSGAIAFAISLLTKAVAPYTNKKLDADNLTSHATLAVASSVKKDHAQEIVHLTTQMLQTRELPEIHEQGFARTFTDIANRLEKHHDITLKGSTDTQVKSTQAAENKKENKIETALSNTLNREKTTDKLINRIEAEANALPAPTPSII